VVVAAALVLEHVLQVADERRVAAVRQQNGNGAGPENEKSAGANLLTFVFLGSPTWARTRDLRINSHIRKVEKSDLSC
jgi:hypothetical protein